MLLHNKKYNKYYISPVVAIIAIGISQSFAMQIFPDEDYVWNMVANLRPTYCWPYMVNVIS